MNSIGQTPRTRRVGWGDDTSIQSSAFNDSVEYATTDVLGFCYEDVDIEANPAANARRADSELVIRQSFSLL